MAVILDLSSHQPPSTLTSGNWPATMRTGRWQFTFTPSYASGAAPEQFYVLLNFASNTPVGDIYLADDSINGRAELWFPGANGYELLTHVTFAAAQTVTVELNIPTGQVVVSGATAGNGTFAFTNAPSSYADGNLDIGHIGSAYVFPGTIGNVEDFTSSGTGTAAGALSGLTGAATGAMSMAGTAAASVPVLAGAATGANTTSIDGVAAAPTGILVPLTGVALPATFADSHALIRSPYGRWQFTFTPAFASSSMALGETQWLLSFNGDERNVYISRNASSGTVYMLLQLYQAGGTYLFGVAFASAATVTVSIDNGFGNVAQAATVTISGTLSGNGTFDVGAPFVVPSGALVVGSKADGSLAFNGTLTDIIAPYGTAEDTLTASASGTLTISGTAAASLPGLEASASEAATISGTAAAVIGGTGGITISGRYLRDAAGNIFAARGPEHVIDSIDDLADIDAIAATGANAMRMLLTLDTINGQSPEVYDQIIGRAVSHGMVVWISLFSWNNADNRAVHPNFGGGFLLEMDDYLDIWERQWLKDIAAKYDGWIIIDAMQEFIATVTPPESDGAIAEWVAAAVNHVTFFRAQGYTQPLEVMTSFQGRDLAAIVDNADTILAADTLHVNGQPQTMFGWQAYWGDSFYRGWQGEELLGPGQSITATQAVEQFVTTRDYPIQCGLDSVDIPGTEAWTDIMPACSSNSVSWLWWEWFELTVASHGPIVRGSPDGFADSTRATQGGGGIYASATGALGATSIEGVGAATLPVMAVAATGVNNQMTAGTAAALLSGLTAAGVGMNLSANTGTGAATLAGLTAAVAGVNLPANTGVVAGVLAGLEASTRALLVLPEEIVVYTPEGQTYAHDQGGAAVDDDGRPLLATDRIRNAILRGTLLTYDDEEL